MSDYEVRGTVTVEDEATANLKKIGQSSQNLVEDFKELGDSASDIDDVTDATEDLTDATEDTADASRDFSDALEDNTDSLDEVSDSAENLTEELTDLGDSADEIDKVTDATENLTTATNQSEEASQRLGRTTKSNIGNFKDLVTGFSGVAAGAFNLYNSYNDLNDKQLAVEKSELAVARATEALNDLQTKNSTLLVENKALTDNVSLAQAELARVQNSGTASAEQIAAAQDKLNTALDKLAANKDQSAGAIRDIEIAEENLRLKTESAQNAQENQQKAIINMAIQAVPSIITIADKVWALKGAWDAVKTSAEAATAISTAASGVSTAVGAAGGGGAAASAGAGLGFASAGATGTIATAAGIGAAPIAAMGAAVLGLSIAAGYGLAVTEQQKKDAAAELASIMKGEMPKPNITHPNGLTQSQIDEYKALIIQKQQQDATKTGIVAPGGSGIIPISDLTGSTGSGGTGGKIYMPGKGWVTIPAAAEGGIVNEPTLLLAGEAGPEKITPLGKDDSGVTIQINAPLISVQGSADRATVEAAKNEVYRMLQNIKIETGSSTSRIRVRSTNNMTPTNTR